jgi:hypothetical protein
MAATAPIRIDGLREFSRDLKRLDAGLPKALRMALNESADLVIGDARPKVPTRSGRARKSMRAASTRTAVRVRAGGKRAPHYPWLDFGGRVGRRRSVARPFFKDGRYLYQSYFDLRVRGVFQETLQDALLDVARQAGVEVESS